MAQTLAMRQAVGATAQVFRNNNGTFSALGAAWAPSTMRTDSPGNNPSNLAAEFAGGFYAVTYNNYRVYVPGSGTWVSEGAFGGLPLLSNAFTGLHVGRGPTGLPRLFHLWANTVSAFFFIGYKDPGMAWAFSAAGPAASSYGLDGNFGGQGLLFRNQLHVSSGRSIVTAAPDTLSITRQTIGIPLAGANWATSFVRAAGRMFAIRAAAVGGDERLNIYEFTAGAYVLAQAGATTSTPLPQDDASNNPSDLADWHCAFYDPAAAGGSGGIVLHAYQDRGIGDRGWRCFVIDLAALGTATEVTSTVVPPALAYPGGPSIVGTGYDVHWHVRVDNEANPTAQVVTLDLLLNNGSWETYQWNGELAAVTSLGTGGDRGVSLSQDQTGGGEYNYAGSTTAAPAYHVEEYGVRVAISGGTRIFFRCYTFDETGGAPTIPDLDVEIRYGINLATQLQAPSVQGTIGAVGKSSGAGTIPTLNGNVCENCTADGATVYFYDWLAVASDGLADGQDHQSMPRIV